MYGAYGIYRFLSSLNMDSTNRLDPKPEFSRLTDKSLVFLLGEMIFRFMDKARWWANMTAAEAATDQVQACYKPRMIRMIILVVVRSS